MKLLPFPWVAATRPLARRLIEHIESCHRIIDRLTEENTQLRSRMNEAGLDHSGIGRDRLLHG